ncbi:glycosyltransferase family 4 protein [Candidatus Magnetominusculus dajiuhuensis]|uniref:glycosyltransferase family 4 protein n=1 Tax=Candidatus Magnetominusculus dajiuhuensis TaxID=3137712 RepID=UPI003B42DA39
MASDVVINARFLTQPFTGVQRYALEISRHLSGRDITFVSPSGPIKTSGLNVRQYGSLKGHLWEQLDLLSYLKTNGNPLLFNLTQTSPFFYKRFVLTLHDISFLINPEWYSRGVRRLYSALVPRLAQRALKIITSSWFSKGEIIRHLNIPENRITVIGGAVSEGFSEKKAKEGFAEPLGDYILAVSSLNPRKNLYNLIRAFKECRFNGIKLVVVGNTSSVYPGSHSDLIGKMIDDNIHLFNYVTDEQLAALYSNSLFFAYPSLYEGFGIPLLEAFVCGCPVMASNTSSMPEVCSDAAYYVNPYDVDSIANGLKVMVEDAGLRQNLVEKATMRAAQFSWRESAAACLKIIEECG